MSERTLLMIPGPIELEPEVLRAAGRATLGHMDPEFARAFGRALGRTREVFGAPGGQPFVIAGSGTLAMELGAANLVEPGDRAVVVNTGFFSDRMGAILERLGAEVTHVRAPLGGAPEAAEIERALAAGPSKVLAVTHVDTSTGVRADVEGLARLATAHGALSLVDGVCATGGERFDQDAWGVDVCLTASQKALGVPPGLALVIGEPPRARRAPGAPHPAVLALPRLGRVAAGDAGLRARRAGVLRHAGGEPGDGARRQPRAPRRRGDGRARRPARAPGRRVPGGLARARAPPPARPRHPGGEHAERRLLPRGRRRLLVGRVRAEGVVIAGGLHPEAKTRYFRVGHMGALTPGDVLVTVGAIERALAAGGHRAALGAGVAAAQAALCHWGTLRGSPASRAYAPFAASAKAFQAGSAAPTTALAPSRTMGVRSSSGSASRSSASLASSGPRCWRPRSFTRAPSAL